MEYSSGSNPFIFALFMVNLNDAPKNNVILLDGNSLTLPRAEAIAQGAEVVIATTVQKRLEVSRKIVCQVALATKPFYGINTGFGYFANHRINKKQLKNLQINLIKSHAAGQGVPLSVPETRLAMALRLNVLVRGYTGVRYELCQHLLSLIKANIYPVIPEYGSVGASGDLIPLAHLALPLMGFGIVSYKGKVMPALQALKAAKLKPIELEEKEALSLINGTQIMLAVGSLALAEAERILLRADKIAALTYEGLQGSPDALNPLIHELRGSPSQSIVAHNILTELSGSYLFRKNLVRNRVQDPYSIRCAPQIHGPCLDAVNYAIRTIEAELNAVTDNPLVFHEQNLILSGGNFHGQALAMAFDFASIAMAEIGSVSDRRLEALLNPHVSGLSAFLSPKAGINSGYMAMQYLTASFVNENKVLANPACTDSIPGNVGIEDYVSMGMTSARKFKRIVKNTAVILAVEMVVAAQAIDLRKAKPLGIGTKKTYESIRKSVPKLTQDRILSEDIDKALEIFNKL